MNKEQNQKKDGGEIKLFGAQIGVQSDGDCKSKSLGKSWTMDEHRLFLEGLEKLGRGNWKGISTNFVTSRTPTQIASHAQKYYGRQSADNMKRRRTSVFDIDITHNQQHNNDAYENSSGPANLMRTAFEIPPVNGPGIYQASLSSSTKGYPATHILVPAWIAVDNYSNQRNPILGFAAPTTNYYELNHNNDNFLGKTMLSETDPTILYGIDREKTCQLDSNNDKNLDEMVLSETEREKVLCEICRKTVLRETTNEMNSN